MGRPDILLRKDKTPHKDRIIKHIEGILGLDKKIKPPVAEKIARNFTALELFNERKEKAVRKYKKQSVIDGLTGLYNRTHLDGDGSNSAEGIGQLEREFAEALRSGHDLSVLMIDIDDFGKGYNDIYGHPAGDVALKTITNAIRTKIRTSDLPFRYGGEELLILLPETNLNSAESAAEKIRKVIEEITILKRPVTVSIGVAAYNKNKIYQQQNVEDKAELVQLADDALYFSKKNGKNSITLGNELTNEQRSEAHTKNATPLT